MARAKRVDNKGRVLRVGESQNKDGRYCYKWTDSNGKRSTVYALTLAELRKKEEQIKHSNYQDQQGTCLRMKGIRSKAHQERKNRSTEKSHNHQAGYFVLPLGHRQ